MSTGSFILVPAKFLLPRTRCSLTSFCTETRTSFRPHQYLLNRSAATHTNGFWRLSTGIYPSSCDRGPVGLDFTERQVIIIFGDAEFERPSRLAPDPRAVQVWADGERMLTLSCRESFSVPSSGRGGTCSLGPDADTQTESGLRDASRV